MGNMKRPNPTKPLIMEMTGGNQELLSCIHHGLSEIDFSKFYPVLDLKELLAFAGTSWKTRSLKPKYFNETLNNKDIYGIFNETYKIGLPWINKNKAISSKREKAYKKTNPFQDKNLEARLRSVNSVDVKDLKKQLSNPVHEYVFACNYHTRKMQRGGNNYRLHSMNFQNVYPKRGRIAPAYATEIAKLINKLPQEYIKSEETAVRVKLKDQTRKQESEQLTCF